MPPPEAPPPPLKKPEQTLRLRTYSLSDNSTIYTCDFKSKANVQRAFAQMKATQIKVLNKFC